MAWVDEQKILKARKEKKEKMKSDFDSNYNKMRVCQKIQWSSCDQEISLH